MADGIRVTLPDGRVVKFPAGTSPEEMQRVIDRDFSFAPKAQTDAQAPGKIGDGGGKDVAGMQWDVHPADQKLSPEAFKKLVEQERAQREAESPGILERAEKSAGKILGPGEVSEAVGGLMVHRNPISAVVQFLAGDPTRALRAPAAGIAGGIGAGAQALQKTGAITQTQSQALERDAHGLLAASAGLPLRAAGPASAPAKRAATGIKADARAMGINRLPIGAASGNKTAMRVQRGINALPGRRLLSQAAADKTRGKIHQRVTQNIDSLGPEMNSTGAGTLIQEAVGRHMEKFFESGRKLEARLNVRPETPVLPMRTAATFQDIVGGKGAFSEVIKGLAPDKAAQLQAAFQKVLDAKGPVTWADVKALRQAVGEARGVGSAVEKVGKSNLKALYKSLSDDMRDALSDPKKIRQWDKTNKFWSDGFRKFEERLRAVEKSKSPDRTMASLASDATRDPTSFRKVAYAMSPKERRELGSYMLRKMGDPVASDAGSGFDMSRYLTQWNKMDPQVKNALFGRRGAIRSDLDRIARVADRLKQYDDRFVNPPNTASQLGDRVSNIAGAGSLVGTVVTGDVTPAAVFLGTVMGANIAQGVARAGSVVPAAVQKTLMSSPKFIKWLARASDAKSTESIPQYLGALNHAARTMKPQEREAVGLYIQTIRESLGR